MSIFFNNITHGEVAVPLSKVFMTLFGIIFLRIFLEHFSSPNPDGLIFPANGIYLHLPLFYVASFLSFSILLKLLTKLPLKSIFLFLLFVHLFILLPPVIDLLLSHGTGYPISYILTNPQDLLGYFFRLPVDLTIRGITPGMRVATSGLFISLGWLIYQHAKSVRKLAQGMFFAYIIFYLYAIIPSFYILNTPNANVQPASKIYADLLSNSFILQTQQSLQQSEKVIQSITLSNYSLGQLFWIFIVIETLILFILENKKAPYIIKTTVRAGRILNFLLISAMGMLISKHISGNSLGVTNLVNSTTLVTFFLLLAIILIWETFINDAEDISIDSFSNANRPLAMKLVTISEWSTIANWIGLLAIFGLFLINTSSAFFLVLLSLCYYLYSSKPLRLKNHFVSSSILIGGATSFTAMAGFFLVSPNQHFSAFPVGALCIIGVAQGLLSNLKDIKDYTGDKQENIRTIPVVFGRRNGKTVIATIYLTVFSFLPLVLNVRAMLPFSIILGLVAFFLIIKKRYVEKYIFLTMFTYIFMLYFFLS